MTPVSRYLQIVAMVLLGLWAIFGFRLSFDPASIFYKYISTLVAVATIYLAIKRPLIAGILLFGLTLLLVWSGIEAQKFLDIYFEDSSFTYWNRFIFFGRLIGPVFIASLLLLVARLVQRRR